MQRANGRRQDVEEPMLPNHALRFELNDEVHARPPEALQAPSRVTYLALVSPWDQRDRERRLVADLAGRYHAPPPRENSNHYSADLGPFRIKWERHSEFARYKFIAPPAADGELFGTPALALVPDDWIAALPGTQMVATNVALIPAGTAELDAEEIGQRYFSGNAMVGARIADGAGTAFTDFRIHADGFSRLLVEDRAMSARQAGRTVQRLLEIDTYRMLALLALPIARELAPLLTAQEQELARINSDLMDAKETHEPMLLQSLTRLSAEIDSRQSTHHYRFSAAEAYYDIVRRRILELREERIKGLQTFSELTERRLAPAINTCVATAGRQASLSQRVARATQLLSTRVDLTREQQNQALLRSMDRRARLQLRLQQTVEGLSAAAITYYVVGMIGSAAKGLKAMGMRMEPDAVAAISIPFVAGLAMLGVHRIRQMVSKPDQT